MGPTFRRSSPTVSVVTVAYNARRFVRECISSVLAQRFTDFELLVCDDCSTDDTWEIIGEFADPRIHAIRRARNIGEYANRNRALSDARGKYIIYIDGDDYVYPHGLERMVGALDSFPRAAFASAQEDSEKFIYPVELEAREIASCLLLGPDVFGANFTQLMFRTDSLRRIGGFDPRFRTGDTYAQVALAMRESCVLISGGLAWWRRYPGNASDVWLSNGRACAEMVRYGGEMLKRPDCPLSTAERRIARALMCRRMLRRVARHLLKFDVANAAELLRVAGASIPEWRYLFSSSTRPFLADVTDADPIRQRVPALPAAVATAPTPRRPAPPANNRPMIANEAIREQLRA